jgi:pheromone shutdown protein TraB
MTNKESVVIELTPERKERLMAVSDEIIDILKKKTHGPMEALILLHLMQESIQEQQGVTMELFTKEDLPNA